MANIFDAAKYILHKMGEISTWKSQKLCYYSQAWSLAWTEEPIFNEDFEAWSNDPVCPQLYYVHKGNFSIDEDGMSLHLFLFKKCHPSLTIVHYTSY